MIQRQVILRFFVKEESFRIVSSAVETAFVVGAVFRVWGLVTISFEVGRGGGANLAVPSYFFSFFLFFFLFTEIIPAKILCKNVHYSETLI